MNALKKAFSFYHQLLQKYPASIQIVQTGCLMGIGDISSQLLFEDKTLRTLDKVRVLKFSAIGLFLIGPGLTKWYKFLDLRITGQPNIVALKKVVLDQSLAAPVLLFCVTSGVSLLDGHSIHETKLILEDKYSSILLNNYKVWPLVQVLNFSFVPLNYQLLVVQTVAIFWNTYLSYSTHQGAKSLGEEDRRSQK